MLKWQADSVKKKGGGTSDAHAGVNGKGHVPRLPSSPSSTMRASLDHIMSNHVVMWDHLVYRLHSHLTAWHSETTLCSKSLSRERTSKGLRLTLQPPDEHRAPPPVRELSVWFTNCKPAQAAKCWVALNAFSHFTEDTAGSFLLSQEERREREGERTSHFWQTTQRLGCDCVS